MASPRECPFCGGKVMSNNSTCPFCGDELSCHEEDKWCANIECVAYHIFTYTRTYKTLIKGKRAEEALKNINCMLTGVYLAHKNGMKIDFVREMEKMHSYIVDSLKEKEVKK